MTELTKLGVAAIRDGVALANLRRVEVADRFQRQCRWGQGAERLHRRNAGEGD